METSDVQVRRKVIQFLEGFKTVFTHVTLRNNFIIAEKKVCVIYLTCIADAVMAFSSKYRIRI